MCSLDTYVEGSTMRRKSVYGLDVVFNAGGMDLD